MTRVTHHPPGPLSTEENLSQIVKHPIGLTLSCAEKNRDNGMELPLSVTLWERNQLFGHCSKE